MNLRAHVHQRSLREWFVDIDDDNDRQPYDPYWCVECRTQEDALAAGCAELRRMYGDLTATRAAGRVSGFVDDPDLAGLQPADGAPAMATAAPVTGPFPAPVESLQMAGAA